MQIAQSRKLSLAALIGCAIAATIILIDVADRMEAMQPHGQTASAIAALPRGAKVKAIVEINGNPANGEFSGTILKEIGASQFQATPKALRIVTNAASHFLMGTQTDLHKGAVVEVSGRSVSSTAVAASQIVVLSGYVTVRP